MILKILIFLFSFVISVNSETTNNHILINNRFALLTTSSCDQTIFIDTKKNNFMQGLEFLINNSKDFQLVTSYGSYYNYSNNHDIRSIDNYISTDDFFCKTYYPLNQKTKKNNLSPAVHEIFLFVIIVICPIFTIYHLIYFFFKSCYKIIERINLCSR